MKRSTLTILVTLLTCLPFSVQAQTQTQTQAQPQTGTATAPAAKPTTPSPYMITKPKGSGSTTTTPQTAPGTTAAPQAGATKIDQKVAVQFYKNCLRQAEADQTMQPITKSTYCQCSMLYFQKYMTMEDVKASVGTDQAARNAINKTMLYVYAPCMEYPVRDLILGQCTKDVQNPKVCSCLSDNMGKYVAKSSQRNLAAILSQNPNVTDPMAAIMGTKEFQRTQEQIAFSCIQTY